MNHSPEHKTPVKRMHQIVWGLVVVFTACAVTFPIAMVRVSQMEKFKGSHIKSWTDQGTAIATVGKTVK
jgi:Mn2+/Fe2+ NRAMP family transporter